MNVFFAFSYLEKNCFLIGHTSPENGTFFPLVGHVLTKSGFFTIFHARKTSRFQRKKNEVEIFQLFPFPRAESR